MRILLVPAVLLLLAGCLGHCGPQPGDITWHQPDLYAAALEHPDADPDPAAGPPWDVAGQEVPLGLSQVSDQTAGRGHPPRHTLQAGPDGTQWTLERVHAASYDAQALRDALTSFLTATAQENASVEELLMGLDANRTWVATEYAGAGNGTEIYRSGTPFDVDLPSLRAATANATLGPLPPMPQPGRVTASNEALVLSLSRATVAIPVEVEGDQERLRVDEAGRAELHGVPPELSDEGKHAWLVERLETAGLPTGGITEIESVHAIC